MAGQMDASSYPVSRAGQAGPAELVQWPVASRQADPPPANASLAQLAARSTKRGCCLACGIVVTANLVVDQLCHCAACTSARLGQAELLEMK